MAGVSKNICQVIKNAPRSKIWARVGEALGLDEFGFRHFTDARKLPVQRFLGDRPGFLFGKQALDQIIKEGADVALRYFCRIAGFCLDIALPKSRLNDVDHVSNERYFATNLIGDRVVSRHQHWVVLDIVHHDRNEVFGRISPIVDSCE